MDTVVIKRVYNSISRLNTAVTNQDGLPGCGPHGPWIRPRWMAERWVVCNGVRCLDRKAAAGVEPILKLHCCDQPRRGLHRCRHGHRFPHLLGRRYLGHAPKCGTSPGHLRRRGDSVRGRTFHDPDRLANSHAVDQNLPRLHAFAVLVERLFGRWGVRA